MDSQDTLAFSSLTGIQTMPLEIAGEAYAKMLAGDVRFRMVLRPARRKGAFYVLETSYYLYEY
jgi:D-arabinose 1-dehydrogenase-like Zn-dependent alcohol dehydrogenase